LNGNEWCMVDIVSIGYLSFSGTFTFYATLCTGGVCDLVSVFLHINRLDVVTTFVIFAPNFQTE